MSIVRRREEPLHLSSIPGRPGVPEIARQPMAPNCASSVVRLQNGKAEAVISLRKYLAFSMIYDIRRFQFFQAVMGSAKMTLKIEINLSDTRPGNVSGDASWTVEHAIDPPNPVGGVLTLLTF